MRNRVHATALTLWLTLLVAGCTHGPGTRPNQTQAGEGEATAHALQARYDDSRTSCNKETQAAFLCSGLLLRRIPRDSEPWSVSAAEQTLGAMVAGYMRADAATRQLPEGGASAVVYYPVLGRPRPMTEYEVLCGSPTPSTPFQREQQGCGKTSAGGDSSARCAERKPPLLSARDWVDNYLEIPAAERAGRLCNFDFRDQAPGAADAFRAFSQTGSVLHQDGQPFLLTTNLVMMSLMPAEPKSALPIEAFVFNAQASAGLREAGDMQRAFYEAGRVWRPVIRMQLPSRFGERAVLTYHPQDQAIKEP